MATCPLCRGMEVLYGSRRVISPAEVPGVVRSIPIGSLFGYLYSV